MTAVQGVFFDLDGTLLDTAPDMIAALNRVVMAEGRPAWPAQALRDHVSHGSAALVRLAFGDDQADVDFERRKQAFLDHYRARLCVETRLFAGMDTVLEALEAQGIVWGVVTNKPGWLTEPLMAQAGLSDRAACIVSGDSTAERKPHPLPMWTAADRAGVDAGACLYIGDAQRDIEAGRAAGMRTLIAGWGYIDEQQVPSHWGADATLAQPRELLAWLTDADVASANTARAC